MKRRLKAEPADSLDLLLDTITNTFGGILLVALLLVLLVRNTTVQDVDLKGTHHQSPEQASVIEGQIVMLENRLSVVMQSFESQKQLDSSFSDPQSKELGRELQKLMNSQNAMRVAEQTLREKSSQLENRLQELESQKEQGKAQAIALAAELAAAESELKSEQDLRTRTMDLPKEEVTFKNMAVIFLKEGHLFFPDIGLVVDGFRLNEAQFEKCAPGQADLVFADQTAVRMISGKGHKIERERIKALLAKIPPDRYYLTVVCNPDSFASFSALRETLVELGFEHRVMPLNTPPAVYETRGAGPAKAQ